MIATTVSSCGQAPRPAPTHTRSRTHPHSRSRTPPQTHALPSSATFLFLVCVGLVDFTADPFEADAFDADPFEADPFEADPFEADAFEADAFEDDAFDADSVFVADFGLVADCLLADFAADFVPCGRGVAERWAGSAAVTRTAVAL